jgi:hypothetical protein
MTKQELMTRYAVAKLASYRKKLGGEHEARIATRFAVEAVESDFKQRTRNCGEDEAMAVLLMDVEDVESVLK